MSPRISSQIDSYELYTFSTKHRTDTSYYICHFRQRLVIGIKGNRMCSQELTCFFQETLHSLLWFLNGEYSVLK